MTWRKQFINNDLKSIGMSPNFMWTCHLVAYFLYFHVIFLSKRALSIWLSARILRLMPKYLRRTCQGHIHTQCLQNSMLWFIRYCLLTRRWFCFCFVLDEESLMQIKNKSLMKMNCLSFVRPVYKSEIT